MMLYSSQGNRLFKEGKFELAKAKYDKVLCPSMHALPIDYEYFVGVG